jgi:hypothetical protein
MTPAVQQVQGQGDDPCRPTRVTTVYTSGQSYSMKATFRPFPIISECVDEFMYLYFLFNPVSIMVHPWSQENHPLVPELQRGDLCRYILTR